MFHPLPLRFLVNHILCMPVIYLPTNFGATIFKISGEINISRNLKWRLHHLVCCTVWRNGDLEFEFCTYFKKIYLGLIRIIP